MVAEGGGRDICVVLAPFTQHRRTPAAIKPRAL
jgi:hypothetical protein